jgi:hypothetical protein
VEPQTDKSADSGVTTAPRTPWWDDFKKPVTVFFIALSILSIGVSVYLYFKGRETRELSMRLVAVTQVYDSSSISRKLSVLDAEKVPVTNDVYVASYQLWNSGTLPIEPADLRRPFTMRLVGDARMLDWAIPYCISDPDVCGFRFEASDTNASPHSVTLNWQHFDTQHGCQFQFLYAGSANGGLTFESPFTGNGRIVDASPGVHLGWLGILILSIGAAVPAFFVSQGIQRLMQRRKVRPNIISLWESFAFFVIAVFIALGFIWVLLQSAPKPPFPPNVPISFKSPLDTGSQQ